VLAATIENVARRLSDLTSQPVPERTTSARELGEEAVTLRDRRDHLLQQRTEPYTQAQRMLTGELILRQDLTPADARDAVEALLGREGVGRDLMRLLSLQGEWLQRIGTDQNLIITFHRTQQVVDAARRIGVQLGGPMCVGVGVMERDTCCPMKSGATCAVQP
jgi:hypothetical protein